MTYEMTCIAHDKHENNLPKNIKDLTLRTKEDHSSESSSDNDIELSTREFKKFIKHETKNKNELKKKLPKKKKAPKGLGTNRVHPNTRIKPTKAR